MVTWKIEVSVSDPMDAAMFARECMTRPDTTAVLFEVTGPYGDTVLIDLKEGNNEGQD